MPLSNLSLSSARLQLTLSNSRQDLEPARQAVLDFLEAQTTLSTVIFKMELILEETLMNIIWHAFNDQETHPIDLTIELEPGVIVMQFEDDGVEFNPLLALAPALPSSIDMAEVGGLGLMLVRKFAQSMTYERANNRNCLRIKVAAA
jgi:anti-sigma regulatory factor (Ser/Thr protein kinase)